MELSVADLVADGVGGIIQHCTQTCSLKLVAYRFCILDVLVANGQDAYLLRSEPQRECACVFFDQERQRSLVAAHGGAVDDIRRYHLVVGVNVFHAKLLCQQHVDLDGDKGILFAEYILDLDIELRTVESSLVHTDGVVDLVFVKQLLHNALCLVPLLGSALVFIGAGGIPLREAEGAILLQAERIKHIHSEVKAALEFLCQLIGTENEVSLGDGELTNTDQTVHLAGILVAEERRGLAKAHGKIAVGALFVEEYLILEGTSHGTESKALLGLIVRIAQNEHTVKVVIPVTGDLVKISLCHQGRFGEQVAALLFLVLYPSLEQLDHASTLGEHNGKSLTDGINGGKELKLTAKLVVVALEGFFLLLQICVHFILRGICDTVDALEHLVLLVALPVSAGALRQLERLDSTCAEEVRSCAKVGKFTLAVEADNSILGELFDQLNLVGLVLFLHQRDRLCTGQLEALDLKIFFYDLFHLALNRFERICAKRNLGVDVIIVAVVDSRTNG